MRPGPPSSPCASSDDSTSGGTTATAKSSDVLATGLIHVTEPASDPVRGGTLVLGEYAEARSLDPTRTYSNGAAGGSALLAVYDSLMAYDWESRTFVPRLAKSLTTDDNQHWTLTLREGVTFSDGTPVDADAVLGSITRYTTAHGYGSVQWLANVTATTKVDDTTVEFTTRSPWGTFPNLLAHGPGLIVAPAAYADPENFTPIGAGPFVFESYQPTEALELRANEDYFGGRPHLDGLKFVWPGGDEAKAEAMAAGDVEAVFMRDDRQVSKALANKTAAMRWVMGQGRIVWMNRLENRDTSMPEVRQALNLAWDPELYMKRNGEDATMATKSLFPDSSPWSTGAEVVEPDPEKAKALVEEAKAKGFDGELEYAHFGDPQSTKPAVTAKAMLESVGFTINLRPLNSVADQIKMLYADRDFDLAVSAMTVNEEDPYLRLAGTMLKESPTNPAGYDDPEVAALIADFAAATGPEDGKAQLARIEAAWQKDPGGLGIATGLFVEAWDDDVHGMLPTTETMTFFDKVRKER